MPRALKRPFSIAVCQLKGGTGRTTLATNLACALDARLIDASNLKYSTGGHWARAREAIDLDVPEVVQARTEGSFQKAFTKSRRGVVIDMTSPNKKFLHLVMGHADLVLVPVTPSEVDLSSALYLLEEYANVHMRARLVWNKVRPRVASEAALMRKAPKGFLKTVLHQRVAYWRALAGGLSVLDPGTGARGAKDEINDLVAEIRSLRSRP